MSDIIYEVDIRDRETGNSVETIFSSINGSEAYEIANNWNTEHGFGNIQEDYESYDELVFAISPEINSMQKYFADVYYVENGKPHGVGKY